MTEEQDHLWLPPLTAAGGVGKLGPRIGSVLRNHYRGRPFAKPLTELTDEELRAIPRLGKMMFDLIREVVPAPGGDNR